MGLEGKSHWLLLRGLARQKLHWGDFPEQLSTRPYADEVLCIDLPGTGEYNDTISPPSIKKIAIFVREKWLQKKKELPQGKWSLLTPSMGGMIALEWAKLYPKDFENMVLINSSAADLSPFYKRLRPWAFLNLAKTPFMFSDKKREESILKVISSFGPSLKHVALEWAEISASSPMTITNLVNQLLAASRFKSPDYISPFLLILASRQDKMVHPKCSEELAKRFKAPIAYHDEAGHDLPLDDPDWVLTQVGMWMQLNHGKQNLADQV